MACCIGICASTNQKPKRRSNCPSRSPSFGLTSRPFGLHFPLGHLWSLNIQEAHRGRGEGTKLMEVFLNDVREAGAKLLFVRPSYSPHDIAKNQLARLQKFYGRSGFEPLIDTMAPLMVRKL